MNIPQIFRDMCPQWTYRLETEDPEELRESKDGAGGTELYIGAFNFCIVGEAHGFMTGYNSINNSSYCDECYAMSEYFDVAFRARAHNVVKTSLKGTKYARIIYPNSLYQLIHEFSEHLDKCHNPKEPVIPQEYLLKPEL